MAAGASGFTKGNRPPRILAVKMPFNSACLGRTYNGPEQLLDEQRHQAYAAAVTGTEMAATPLRPLACFAAVYLLGPIVPQLFSDQEVGLDLAHLLHGEQEFWFERRLDFGEAVTPLGVITRAEERRGMVFLELRCDGRDREGSEVAHSRSLFLVRSPT